MKTQLFKNRQAWLVLAITLVGLALCAWLMALPSAWAERAFPVDKFYLAGRHLWTTILLLVQDLPYLA